MGQISGMQYGRKHFKTHEVQTLPNGELQFKTLRIEPPTSEEKRPGTTLLPSWHHMITPQKSVLAPESPAPLESGTKSVMAKKENRAVPNKRPTGLPDTPHSVIKTCHQPPEEFLCDQGAVKKDRPTPSFTPDTYILIQNADKASWI